MRLELLCKVVPVNKQARVIFRFGPATLGIGFDSCESVPRQSICSLGFVSMSYMFQFELQGDAIAVFNSKWIQRMLRQPGRINVQYRCTDALCPERLCWIASTMGPTNLQRSKTIASIFAWALCWNWGDWEWVIDIFANVTIWHHRKWRIWVRRHWGTEDISCLTPYGLQLKIT